MVGRAISGTDPQLSSATPERQADRDAIRAQLEHIVSSPLFRNSKRCHALLCYVVTEVLEGRGEQLKERTIGVAAFGREPNYDTNDDPIVRTSAMEVRKRLAQYYHEPGRETELRIDLTSGSYVPDFRFLQSGMLGASAEGPPVREPRGVGLSATHGPVKVVRKLLVRLVWGLMTVALVVVAGIALWPRDPLKAFWAPVWHNANTITVTAGTSVDQASEGKQPTGSSGDLNSLDTFRADQLGFADAITMARVSALVRFSGKQFEIRRAASLTLDDLRKTPGVLIGAINNPWTMRLNAALRFSIERDRDSGIVQIIDRQKGSRVLWRSDPQAPYSRRAEDRAVISRFTDPRTEQTVVLLAGVGRDGTIAAGEFVTQSKYLEDLAMAHCTKSQGGSFFLNFSTT